MHVLSVCFYSHSFSWFGSASASLLVTIHPVNHSTGLYTFQPHFLNQNILVWFIKSGKPVCKSVVHLLTSQVCNQFATSTLYHLHQVVVTCSFYTHSPSPKLAAAPPLPTPSAHPSSLILLRELCRQLGLSDLEPGLQFMTSPTKELLNLYEVRYYERAGISL